MVAAARSRRDGPPFVARAVSKRTHTSYHLVGRAARLSAALARCLLALLFPRDAARSRVCVCVCVVLTGLRGAPEEQGRAAARGGGAAAAAVVSRTWGVGRQRDARHMHAVLLWSCKGKMPARCSMPAARPTCGATTGRSHVRSPPPTDSQRYQRTAALRVWARHQTAGRWLLCTGGGRISRWKIGQCETICCVMCVVKAPAVDFFCLASGGCKRQQTRP